MCTPSSGRPATRPRCSAGTARASAAGIPPGRRHVDKVYPHVMSRLPFVWDEDTDEPTLWADAQDAGPCRISACSRRLPASAPASGCHCLLLPRIRLSPVISICAERTNLGVRSCTETQSIKLRPNVWPSGSFWTGCDKDHPAASWLPRSISTSLSKVDVGYMCTRKHC